MCLFLLKHHQSFLDNHKYFFLYIYLLPYTFVMSYVLIYCTELLQPMTFQAILTTNGKHSFALFYYKHEEMLEKLAVSENSCAKIQVGFSAGKYYSNYLPNSTDIKQTPLNPFILVSNNKLVIKLDNKSVNSSGCNTKGTYVHLHT